MAKAAYIGVGLPAGYQQVEYIQATGTQYITTGVTTSDNIGIYCDFSVANTNDVLLIGGYNGDDSRFGINPSGGSLFMGWNSSYNAGSIAIGQRYKVEYNYLNARKRIVNGVEKDPIAQTLSSANTYPLYLFIGCWDSPTPAYGASGNCYRLKITQGNTVVRDFVPCIRLSDNAVGMYCTVTNAFFGNDGSGVFSAGSKDDKARKGKSLYVGVGLPAGYQQVAYIQANGEEYINTGFSTTTGMVCEYQAMFLDTTGGYIAGSHNAASPYGRNGAYWSERTQWEFGYGETCPSLGSGTVDTVYRVKFSTKIYDAYLDVDGNRLISTSGQSTSGTPVYLFTNQYALDAGSAKTKAIVYFVKIWDSSDKLARNLIPCIRLSDNTVGMYCTVTNAFYGNAGSGAFLSGANVYGKGIARKCKKAYVSVDGIARLFYHSKKSYGRTAIEFMYEPGISRNDAGEITTFNSGTMALHLYKEDNAATNVYLNDALMASLTASGSHTVNLFKCTVDNCEELSKNQYVVKIESNGKYYPSSQYTNGDTTYASPTHACIRTSSVNCAKFSYIELDDNVTVIQGGAFVSAVAGAIYEIPATITSIGLGALSGTGAVINYKGTIDDWFKITSEKRINTSTGVAIDQFDTYSLSINDTLVENITVPNSYTSIPGAMFRGCTSIKNVQMPPGITSIGRHAFQSCFGLLSIDIPSGVTEVANYAFDGCSSLESANIPNTVTNIGMYAFRNCEALNNLIIPSSVTAIESGAFRNSGMSNITFMHKPGNSLTLETSLFYNKTARDMTVNHYGNAAVTGYDYEGDNVTVTLNQLG